MSLFQFDQELRERYKKKWILGVDEVGRGPLAGPVVACAVKLPDFDYPDLKGIQDSKVLSPERREIFFERMSELKLSYELGWALPHEIDHINILQATFLAMRRAIQKIGDLSDSLFVVDGNHKIPDISCPQISVVKGDAKSLAVCCAGVAAKVIRDRWMRHLERLYPGYGLGQHKGYGTAEHLAALEKLGPSRIHRRSFSPVVQPEFIKSS
ncbi:MAG: ribonuclease HII [Elusimicrobia bacterium]|nr:ribonuclease HII [Elusimicrobiota bacterium]